MSIDTGRYTIKNVKQLNIAYLPDSNDGTPIAATFDQNNESAWVSFPHILPLS
jgi:hypothetical protein